MFSINEILNSKKFQTEAPAQLKHIIRKVNREAERKNPEQNRKDNQKKNAA